MQNAYISAVSKTLPSEVRILLDLIALNFQFPDFIVNVAIGLGILVGFGLVIRENIQGAERGISHD
jgi:hypothetical protein